MGINRPGSEDGDAAPFRNDLHEQTHTRANCSYSNYPGIAQDTCTKRDNNKKYKKYGLRGWSATA